MVLVVIIGLLNFHPPHFLLEAGRQRGDVGTYVLETALAAMLLAAVVVAVGIYRDRRWAWLLGITIAAVGAALYVVQQTVGLPGLPQNWWEPSRLVTLVAETTFVLIGRDQPRSRRWST